MTSAQLWCQHYIGFYCRLNRFFVAWSSYDLGRTTYYCRAKLHLPKSVVSTANSRKLDMGIKSWFPETKFPLTSGKPGSPHRDLHSTRLHNLHPLKFQTAKKTFMFLSRMHCFPHDLSRGEFLVASPASAAVTSSRYCSLASRSRLRTRRSSPPPERVKAPSSLPATST